MERQSKEHFNKNQQEHSKIEASKDLECEKCKEYILRIEELEKKVKNAAGKELKENENNHASFEKIEKLETENQYLEVIMVDNELVINKLLHEIAEMNERNDEIMRTMNKQIAERTTDIENMGKQIKFLQCKEEMSVDEFKRKKKEYEKFIEDQDADIKKKDKKIEILEREVQQLRLYKFNNKNIEGRDGKVFAAEADKYPAWWKTHVKSVNVSCPSCCLLYDSNKLDDHLAKCFRQ